MKEQLIDRERNLECAMEEVRVLSRLSHTNIARYHDSFKAFEQGKEYLYIAMEFASRGTLADFIKKSNIENSNSPNSFVKFKFIYDVASGLKYIHNLHSPLIHRDLKPENVVITESKGILIAKLIDFGVATEEKPDLSSAGTRTYMSLEKISNNKYGIPDDMWAFGHCLKYQLVFQ